MVLFDDGLVAAFGANSYGQLGDGSEINKNVPVLVNFNSTEGIYTKIASISAGSFHRFFNFFSFLSKKNPQNSSKFGSRCQWICTFFRMEQIFSTRKPSNLRIFKHPIIGFLSGCDLQ